MADRDADGRFSSGGETIVVINEGLESRTRNGKTRFTVSVSSEPVLHNFGPMDLGAPVSLAIKDAIAKGIKAIGEQASAGTVAFRAEASKAFARGANWARKRYSGGKTGAVAPGTGSQLFIDSGRLANGLTLRQSKSEGKWVVYAPANRMNGSGFADQGAFIAMVNRLRELVPALRNPFADQAVRDALEKTVGEVLVRKLARTTKSAEQSLAAIGRAVEGIAAEVRDAGDEAEAG